MELLPAYQGHKIVGVPQVESEKEGRFDRVLFVEGTCVSGVHPSPDSSLNGILLHLRMILQKAGDQKGPYFFFCLSSGITIDFIAKASELELFFKIRDSLLHGKRFIHGCLECLSGQNSHICKHRIIPLLYCISLYF